MSAIFADTFYFIGLMSSDDKVHERCVQFSRQYRGIIVTTSWVLTELADGLAKPPLRVGVGRLIEHVRASSRFRVIPLSESLLERGLSRYGKRPDKEWSLTDCISFVVMEDERITEALTGDRHFEQAGFAALLK